MKINWYKKSQRSKRVREEDRRLPNPEEQKLDREKMDLRMMGFKNRPVPIEEDIRAYIFGPEENRMKLRNQFPGYPWGKIDSQHKEEIERMDRSYQLGASWKKIDPDAATDFLSDIME